MTPLHMIILIECFLGQEHSWTDDATGSDKAVMDLEEDGLISPDFKITNKGLAWIERAVSTPMPVQKWVFE